MRSRCSRRIRLAALSFLSFAVLLTGASIAARDSLPSDATSLRQRLESLNTRKERVRRELRSVKRRTRTVNKQLAEMDVRLDRTEARLGEVKDDVRETRRHLTEAAKECRVAEARLADQRETVSDRLVAIYEQGEVQPLEVLLQSTSFTDFANRLYLLNLVVASDAELLGQLEESRTRADQHRAALAAHERKMSQLEDQMAAEKRRVAQQRSATAQEKNRLLASRAEWERALVELEQDSREITALLQRLQRTGAGKARVSKPWKGSFIRPVQGRISSGYGYRTHPIFRVRKMHTGIDIAAPSGTPIRAAAGGSVVFAGRWGGYGNCIIIDHGGAVATLYGHCSRIAVSEGATVSQGQTIGYVGSTGLATGPHLHFETRRDGRPVDPNGF